MKHFLSVLLAAIVLMACHNAHEEETYLLFLYNNMSLPDRVEMDTAYYRAQVAAALTARAELPWGNEVPEREFRHFVLPPRVNNEDLDDFRQRYYTELRDRVKALSMPEAILEVNHWCHEHATYRPTSARTLGPVSTIRTAYGRCGEESVLLVAALRTVGIPARQVYTPRWAHTDDNHAWVEAWADGHWHFLGACEPEPILDLGWFNESASRGMLMHTKVFGNYDGPEEVVKRDYALTEINVIDNYAPATRLNVTVLDSLDRPVPNATVEFKIYNYAEFYTVASKTTDAHGHASLTAGHGSLLLWATAPPLLASRLVTLPADSAVTLHLNPHSSFVIHHSSFVIHHSSFVIHHSSFFNLTPPPASATLPTVTAEQRAENDRRLAVEDSLRHAYEATMPDQRSRGNHAVITAFLDSAAALGLSYFAEQLVATLPDKDLQDITLPVLLDNLPAEQAGHDIALTDIGRSYLLSPRIECERLTPFKAVLSQRFHDFNAEQLIAWARDSITVIDDQNPQHLRMTPLGVLRSRTADALGRDIFFVAACRSIGIPARINEINAKVQYLAPSNQWQEALFTASNPQSSSVIPHSSSSRLILSYQPSRFVPDAKYYIHFTLSRLGDDGRLQLLTYPEEATARNTFAQGVELDAGTYVLTTGTRLADGSVLAAMQPITLRAGTTLRLPFSLREQADAISVIGSLNAEDLYQPLTSVPSANPHSSIVIRHSPSLSLLSTAGRGYYVLGLIAPNHEPTNHALRDIARVAKGFNKWGRSMILLFDSPAAAERFNFSEFSSASSTLPTTVVWGADIDNAIRDELIAQLHLPNASLPIFVIADSFNRVVYVSQGYTIGLGTHLLKVIQQL